MPQEQKHSVVAAPPPRLLERLESCGHLVCIGHVTPDPDCLGATLALARAWSSAGREVNAAIPNGSLSARMAFMVDLAGVQPAGVEDFARADGFFIADTASLSRCNVPAGVADDWASGKPLVCVDHHVSNSRFGDVNWVVEAAASTCELVYALLVAANLEIDAVCASLLFAGIYTDTAGFSLPSTSDTTFHVAGDLVARGADVADLGRRLRRSLSLSDFMLQRVIYDNTHLAADGRIAYAVADYDAITGAGCSAADIDEQVNIPRSLDGIEIAILFTEGERGRTRINLRGEGGVDVLELAGHFGGGGHKSAAGVVLHCSAAEAVARVLPVAEAMRNARREYEFQTERTHR